ncbi:putative transporter permease protein [Nonlabens dokdonensis DSW-6]|uniref:Putative transporter permease protein n=1 Tax=Nonlabens dokdonensis (strain DSM 17205 / KCTC 12402 / DSW-6) TaxID=592029 RepID=L7WC29_NONDD|nr:putative transporter permease protein [Nonlabens dokdonensis DSW-6]
MLTIMPVNKGSGEKMAASFAGLEYALPENFPEIETLVSLYSGATNFKTDSNSDNTTKTNVLTTEIKVWDVFDFKILQGNPKEFISGTDNLVITKGYKDTYFPNVDPVGLIIKDAPVYGADANEYLITGIIEDIPSNTHLRAQAIVIEPTRREQLYKEGYGSFRQNYMVTKSGTDIPSLTEKVNQWYKDFIGTESTYQYEFQPITDVYLHSEFEKAQEVQGDYNSIFILSGIALLLLIIACINFVNLSASRSLQRIKEVGVRKILGANNKAITQQFLVESILYFLISTVIATAIYYVTLPLLELYVGHPIAITFAQDLGLLATGYAIVLLVSIFVGLYPALLMSRLKTAASLKGSFRSSGANLQPFVQKGLVTFQFVISMVVLIGLIVVDNQVDFMKNKDLGYNTENLLSISNISWDNKGESFKNRLLKIPGIKNASITSFLPGTSSAYMTKKVEDPFNQGQFLEVNFIKGDVDLPATLGLKLESGRVFNKNRVVDAPISKTRYVFNDSIKKVNMQSSLISEYTAQTLDVQNLNTVITGVETVPVGLLKDFHSESLRHAMTPNVIIAESNPQYGGMLIKMNPLSIKPSLVQLQALWKEVYPVKLLDLNWVDETVQKQYDRETRLQHFFSFFTGLSMLLAALGILGLIAQATTLRTKEIGIRKVLGASVSSIVILFSKDFVKIVAIASIIAAPISYFFLNQWLEGFAYRTEISWWMFAVAGVSALTVSIITIGFQTTKAASANPVKSLKD